MNTTYFEIKNFIFSNIGYLRSEAIDYEYLDLTIAIDDDCSTWSYQTGNNSFTGACYSLPHRAVFSICPDSDPLEVYESIIDQLEDLTLDS